MRIHLLGHPEIERGEEVGVSPRGRKTWAVLAYVLWEDRPVSRSDDADEFRVVSGSDR